MGWCVLWAGASYGLGNMLSEKNQEQGIFWLKYSFKLQKELTKRYLFKADLKHFPSFGKSLIIEGKWL